MWTNPRQCGSYPFYGGGGARLREVQPSPHGRVPHDCMGCPALCPCPLELVALVAAEKVELPDNATDAVFDDRAHQDAADALLCPRGIEPRLVVRQPAVVLIAVQSRDDLFFGLEQVQTKSIRLQQRSRQFQVKRLVVGVSIEAAGLAARIPACAVQPEQCVHRGVETRLVLQANEPAAVILLAVSPPP